jgi:uracil-DNA glycosylase family 4
VSVDRAELSRWLRQLSDLGVDELYLENLSAFDALEGLAGRGSAASAARSIAPEAVAVPAVARVREVSQPVVAHDASPAALDATSALQVLGNTAAVCTACRLHETRTSVVFGEGSATADVVVVGEAPGQEEDRTGRPFVGRAGKLLDLLLMTAGLPRDDVFICNTLKCRPPQNRNPLPDEMAACSGYLRGQLDAIAPRVLLAVGKFAAQALLQSDENISRLRGRVHTYQGTPLVVTYHPAYLLRSPQMTRLAWQDFQQLRRVLDEQPRN